MAGAHCADFDARLCLGVACARDSVTTTNPGKPSWFRAVRLSGVSVWPSFADRSRASIRTPVGNSLSGSSRSSGIPATASKSVTPFQGLRRGVIRVPRLRLPASRAALTPGYPVARFQCAGSMQAFFVPSNLCVPGCPILCVIQIEQRSIEDRISQSKSNADIAQ